MRDARSELGRFDKDFVDGGDNGDGADMYGIAPYCAPYRQNPDADRVWYEPEQLAALIAKEEADIYEDENLGDDADVEEIVGDENDPIDYELVAMREINPAEIVIAMELIEHTAGGEDTRQGGTIGLRRAACAGTGVWSVGGWDNRTRPDNSRGRRQRVKRARKAASVSKAMLTAIAA